MGILVTGGTGYIGSHTVVELMAAGHDVLIIDNLCNSKTSVLDRIQRIAGRRPQFEQIDVRDRPALRRLLASHRFDAVIHFAGLKAVGESVQKPLEYYDNNVSGSVALVECILDSDDLPQNRVQEHRGRRVSKPDVPRECDNDAEIRV